MPSSSAPPPHSKPAPPLHLNMLAPATRRASPAVILLSFSLLLSFFLLSHILRPRHPPSRGPSSSSSLPAADFHSVFLSLDGPDANATVAAHLRALTSTPHLAGTPGSLAAADYVRSHLRAAGLKTLVREYHPLLSYPLHASLDLHPVHDDHGGDIAVRPLSLSEARVGRMPGLPDPVMPYHAYSPSGSVLAHPVYANLGRDEDFRELDRMGVPVAGTVVLVRSGAGYRGATVLRAAERGAAAVVMFKEYDVGGDDEVGRGGVERGTVLLGGPGDPLTPGWAGGERLSMDDERVRRRFPTIPSMPVPLDAAMEILRTLRGPRVPGEWRGRLGLPEDAGVGPGSAKVNFTYMEERKLARIQNVFGVIEGTQEPDRYIILGNHRDAWTYGAVDPNSGTATLLEVARRLGVLLKMGWRPRRTMILSSWDGEEFGMIGSTEWVEENLGNLVSKTVAYLNVDCAVQGPSLFASATPQLDKLLNEVTKRVKDPDSNGISVFQAREAAMQGTNIERLGRADSDFTAFLHHAGIPSVDLYYGKDFPVYHTSFDSYDWMVKYGDPLFHRHIAVAGIWGLLALRLADDPLLPFDYLSYIAQLQEHIQAFHPLVIGGSLEPINASIHDFIGCAKEAASEAQKLNQDDLNSDTEQKRRFFNDRLMLVERGFLDAEGLQGRHWFKHMLYAPPYSASGIGFFPGILDAIHNASTAANEGGSSVPHEIWRVARAIRRAALALAGQLP